MYGRVVQPVQTAAIIEELALSTAPALAIQNILAPTALFGNVQKIWRGLIRPLIPTRRTEVVNAPVRVFAITAKEHASVSLGLTARPAKERNAAAESMANA